MKINTFEVGNRLLRLHYHDQMILIEEQEKRREELPEGDTPFYRKSYLSADAVAGVMIRSVSPTDSLLDLVCFNGSTLLSIFTRMDQSTAQKVQGILKEYIRVARHDLNRA